MPALLSVTYTPNYIGPHRICFRTTQPSYCCYTDSSASVIGVPKTTVIELDEFETCLQDLPSIVGCSDTPLDGYIQPFCVDQGSDLNRITFTADYPSNACQSYRVQCNESGIAQIEVTEQGLGWLFGEVPTVTITDLSGYGSGATAEAVMACNDAAICYVESITIIDPGEFYYLINQIVIDISLPTDPGGTPAQAQVALLDTCGTFTILNCDGSNNPAQYQLWGGALYGINVCSSGPGPSGPKYFISPNASEPGLGPELITSFSPTGNFFITGNLEWNGGTGSPYAPDYLYCEPDIPGGTIENGDILNPGFTYEIIINAYSDGNNNAITISSGANSISTGNYVGFTPSTPFTLVAGGTGIIIDIPLSDKPTFVGGVSIRQVLNIASCCDCTKYEVVNTALTGDPLEFYYTACDSQEITLATIDPQDTILDICAVPGSIWAKNPSDNRFLEFIISGIQDC